MYACAILIRRIVYWEQAKVMRACIFRTILYRVHVLQVYNKAYVCIKVLGEDL